MALSSTSSDDDVLAAYENNARHWESYVTAANLCEAIQFILNRFNRMNTIAGKSWTREDLTKLLSDANASRRSFAPKFGAGARTYYTKARMC